MYTGIQNRYVASIGKVKVLHDCIGHTIALSQYVRGAIGVLDTTGISHSDH